MLDQAESTPKYIPYPKAMQVLREWFSATPVELAAWLMFGDSEGCDGLPAYFDANLSAEPPALDFDSISPYGFD